MTTNYPLNWVTAKKMAELTGYTVKALYDKIYAGIFIEGIHFKKSPDKRVHFNLNKYEQWLEQDQQTSCQLASSQEKIV